MANKRNEFVLWLLISVLSFPAFAGDKRANFLSHGPGARPAAMGSAYVALSEDVFGMYYNPAGLAGRGGEAALEHSPLAGGGRTHFAGVIAPFKIATFGVGIFQYAEAGITARKTYDAPGTEISAEQSAFFFPVAMGWGESGGSPWRLGAAVKVIREQLAGYSDLGMGADIGVMKIWRVGTLARGRAGYAIRNLVRPRIRLKEEEETWDREHRVGAAWTGRTRASRDQVTLSAEGGFQNGWGKWALGVEYVLGGLFSIRGGGGNGWWLGMGWAFLREGWSLDYAAGVREESNFQRFTVGYKWGPSSRDNRGNRPGSAAFKDSDPLPGRGTIPH